MDREQITTVESTKSDLLARLRNIDPYEFEEFVADLWRQQGWEATVSQSSNDMGVDVIAEKTGMVDQKLAIQAKRYAEGNKIGRQDVQQYHSMKVQDATADAAVVVTTSSFSSPAEEWAGEHNVKLIDGSDLVDIVQEHNAHALVDEYAPTLRQSDLDPASDADQSVEMAERAGDDHTRPDLPEVLDDEENRKKIGVGGVVIGLLLIANPWAVQAPIEVAGTLAALGAVAVWQFPEEVWSFVTPDREVLREFTHGGAVVQEKGTVKYEPPGDHDPIVFDGVEDEQERRQRAAVYGSLDGRSTGPLTETEPGVLPTEIASQGEDTIAAYRYAVHGESPATIAGEMNITQQEVVDHLASVANEQTQ